MCTWRFSFHEFYNVFLFYLLIFIFFVNSLLFSIHFVFKNHDIYPRRFLFHEINIYNFSLFFFSILFFTHGIYPHPRPTTHDTRHLATLDSYLTSRRPQSRPKRGYAIDGLAQFLQKPKDTNISFSTS